MDTYKVDSAKRKKVLKQVIKEIVKNARGFSKFCYVLTMVLRIIAFVLGFVNILYVVFFSSYALDIIYLIMTFGFPYGLSFLSAIVYIISCDGEYRLRRRETITLVNEGFVYSYHDDRVGREDTIFGFNVQYDKIQQFEYDKNTHCITLYGNILVDTYENGELKSSDEYNEITILDIFEIDVKALLEKNCS